MRQRGDRTPRVSNGGGGGAVLAPPSAMLSPAMMPPTVVNGGPVSASSSGAGSSSQQIRPAADALSKANEHTWLVIGQVSEQMQLLDRATAAYEHALRHNPMSVKALTRVASIARMQEDYPKAVEFFQAVLKLQEDNGEVWSALGHCYLMQDDLQKAYSAYQQALYLLPNPKEDPKLWYGIGILYDRYGSLDHAEEAFSSVLKMEKVSELDFDKANEILFRLGIIYKQQSNYDESLNCFDKILKNPPSPLAHADIWFQIGHVYEQQKNYVEAKNAYERVVADNPFHAKVLQQLGWLYHQDGSSFQNQDLAINYLTKSLEADAADAQSWYLLGRAYMVGRKYNKAYEAYQQAVYRDGRNPTFWCSIGVLYFQINQYRDALDAYSRAIRINPYISEVWFDLGSLYESCNNQVNDALDAYKRALELDPDNEIVKERLQVLRSGGGDGADSVPAPQDVHPTQYATATVPTGFNATMLLSASANNRDEGGFRAPPPLAAPGPNAGGDSFNRHSPGAGYRPPPIQLRDEDMGDRDRLAPMDLGPQQGRDERVERQYPPPPQLDRHRPSGYGGPMSQPPPPPPLSTDTRPSRRERGRDSRARDMSIGSSRSTSPVTMRPPPVNERAGSRASIRERDHRMSNASSPPSSAFPRGIVGPGQNGAGPYHSLPPPPPPPDKMSPRYPAHSPPISMNGGDRGRYRDQRSERDRDREPRRQRSPSLPAIQSRQSRHMERERVSPPMPPSHMHTPAPAPMMSRRYDPVQERSSPPLPPQHQQPPPQQQIAQPMPGPPPPSSSLPPPAPPSNRRRTTNNGGRKKRESNAGSSAGSSGIGSPPLTNTPMRIVDEDYDEPGVADALMTFSRRGPGPSSAVIPPPHTNSAAGIKRALDEDTEMEPTSDSNKRSRTSRSPPSRASPSRTPTRVISGGPISGGNTGTMSPPDRSSRPSPIPFRTQASNNATRSPSGSSSGGGSGHGPINGGGGGGGHRRIDEPHSAGPAPSAVPNLPPHPRPLGSASSAERMLPPIATLPSNERESPLSSERGSRAGSAGDNMDVDTDSGGSVRVKGEDEN